MSDPIPAHAPVAAGAPPLLVAPGAAAADVADALRRALAAETPAIPPKFFYDDLGSRLFAAITALPEYYPPRIERALLRAHLTAMVAAVPVHGATWIDLGAGDCQKSASLFAAVRPDCYVAVDIAAGFLADSLACLQRQHPGVRMLGVVADFSERLVLPPGVPAERRVFFYPGSSIGNFDRPAAVQFLRDVRQQMGADGALWIGVDLHKDKAVLDRAYDDELGVTAAFNRNVLAHVNRLAGTDFALAEWRHVAFYDERRRRVEMHLEALADTVVRWPGGARPFRAGDRIHTENSHKHDLDGFRDLLARAGLRTAGCWTDPDGWYAFFVAAPAAS